MIFGDLPPAPSKKTGWPWIVQPFHKSSGLSDSGGLPSISIVTPSYNQANFLEETIRSVLLQGYPNLEYIVIDGGSTDESVAIIQKYENWLTFWCSEPDRGQSHALNKGFAHATGTIRGYLNSDDVLKPGALQAVARAAMEYEKTPAIFFGSCEMGGEGFREPARVWEPKLPIGFVEAACSFGIAPQPATFWTETENKPAHMFDEQLSFCMDHDMWCRLLREGYQPIRVPETLAFYRHHPAAKGNVMTGRMWAELAPLALSYIEDVSSAEERLKLMRCSRARTRQYWRLEVEKVWKTHSRLAASHLLIKVVATDPGLLFERPTMGLIRKLFWPSRNE